MDIKEVLRKDKYIIETEKIVVSSNKYALTLESRRISESLKYNNEWVAPAQWTDLFSLYHGVTSTLREAILDSDEGVQDKSVISATWKTAGHFKENTTQKLSEPLHQLTSESDKNVQRKDVWVAFPKGGYMLGDIYLY